MKYGFELKNWMLWDCLPGGNIGFIFIILHRGGSSFLSISDGLDSNHVQYMVAAENTQRFGYGNPQAPMGKALQNNGVKDLIIGLPRLQKIL